MEIRIGRLLGIPITFHVTLLVFLFLWLVFSPSTILYILLGFLSIVPHEFGHILCARYYGISCHKVMLMPFGGLAFLEELPKEWWKEFWIALWGPIVSLFLAIWFLPLALLTYQYSLLFVYLVAFNLGLVVLNLLPIHPMDGGRILRALLASVLRHEVATKIALRIGQICAVLVAVVALLFGQWFLFMTMMFILFLNWRAR